MSIETKKDWGEVERRAARHEASVNALMAAAGMPMVRITCEDRLKGSIIQAMSEIEQGLHVSAFKTLQEALKL